MGFFLHLLIPLKEISLDLQTKIVSAVNKERRFEKAIKDFAMLKAICDAGKVLKLPYVKTLLQNTADEV